ncbi:MAG: bifunctional phosphoribosylaminoimidazolecarboxamide formyltransferase/IMP cyclohydrolase [Acidimicrobiia bacterium]|nr:bifunctional phosphoribosylaminoimidazolecarboxamide formyltransferase/IMP cyclohydrolase [Acidimicrobiia bacterium]
MNRRALLSVSDKTGLVEFATGLVDAGWQVLASGGTAAALATVGLEVADLADHTGSPAMLGHRVVTLHPKIHGGILADRSDPAHRADMDRYGIEPIDLVVVNLYPFETRPGVETIDIGGPALIRAAAKNHRHVGVVCDPSDYPAVLDEIRSGGWLSGATRRTLARKAFARTAAYDGAIVSWLDERDGEALLPPSLHLSLERAGALRYGENPDQPAASYRRIGTPGGPDDAEDWWNAVVQHGGVSLSYLNLLDAGAAWALVHDLGDQPAAAIIKHAGPCGAAIGEHPVRAYRSALACDERAAFGGVVALNRPVDIDTAGAMAGAPQADVIIAPGYGGGVVERLRAKRAGTRILEAPTPRRPTRTVRRIEGVWLVQGVPPELWDRSGWRVVSRRDPGHLVEDAAFAWRVAAHVASNAAVLARSGTAWGIGGGQQDRVGAVEIAVGKASGRAAGGVCASDGFFPFPDGIEAAAAGGVELIIQPGGSVNDRAVVEAADRLGLSMIFTGQRRFRH